MSTNATSPATLFGGSWTKIEGRFLWATGSTPMTTGGSRTTDSTVLTVNQIPSHTHSIVYANNGKYVNLDSGGSSYNLSWGSSGINSAGIIAKATGGGQGHTHTYMPPYFEVYMWYRTA